MPIPAPSRRRFLAGSLALAASNALPAAEAPYSQEMPDMLLRHLARDMNALAEKWDGERLHIRTAADLETRNHFVRQKFREMIHGLPERSELTPIVVRTHARTGYPIETVIFHRRPTFSATANP